MSDAAALLVVLRAPGLVGLDDLRDWLAGAAGGPPSPAFWRGCRARLKPGAHAALVVAGGPADLPATALRLGGFEVRDGLLWLGGATVVLARNPPVGGVAENVLSHGGAGALRIADSRTPFASDADRDRARLNGLGPVERFKTSKAILEGGKRSAGFADTFDARGRWPTNLLLLRKSGEAAFPGDGEDSPARYFPVAPDLPALLRWLVRLLILKGGTVLEPLGDPQARDAIAAVGGRAA